jgi:hypothetical protein
MFLSLRMPPSAFHQWAYGQTCPPLPWVSQMFVQHPEGRAHVDAPSYSTEPMFCYEFRKENGKKEERLRRKEWIFIEEMACSRRLLSYLAFEVPRTSKFLQNRIQSECPKSSLTLLFIQHKKATNKTSTNTTTN